MKTFCVDIGNTRTHYGLVEAGEALAAGSLATEALRRGGAAAELRELAELAGRADGVALASVVPDARAGLEAALGGERAVFQLSPERCGGLPIDYPRPEQIGQDRLANALAAWALFGAPAVVVDSGTAVTFDIVSAAGGYEGGAIAPGPALMTRYLRDRTALLPAIDEPSPGEPESVIGKSTEDAMRIGCVVGFRGMVDALLDRIVVELRARDAGEPIVLTTGGAFAGAWARGGGRARHVPHLTLIGLAAARERG